MNKFAGLSALDRPLRASGWHLRRALPRPTKYFAFLSYSHSDEKTAEWLHAELERFAVPPALAGRLTGNGVIPRRLRPIFRDQHELAAADDLGEEIEAALGASQFLIVLCSPAAARSEWTNAEIDAFKRTRPEGCILAAIASGEPFANEIPGREGEECFPPALRYKYDRRGRPTTKRAEPLAADLRDSGDGRRLGLLKLIAGMLGVGLDDLVQREATRRHRRMAWLAAGSLAGMAVTSTLAVFAVQSRNEAREQRREAEGLVAFMLGDLKDKLEPIGRLDALDGVGSRVLAYYRNQDAGQMSDAALTQRSRALSLMAEVASLRGDFTGASRLYREAMAGTEEAIRRSPDDPQRLFDHAQNVFYFGQMRRSTGDLRAAEAAMREYKRLALQMVAAAPDNMKWRMEEQYAEVNLGVVLQDQARYAEASRQFAEGLRTIEAISTADPTNLEYRQSVAETFAWLSDSLRTEGRLAEAIAARQQGIAILEQLFASTKDFDYRHRLIPARRTLGELYADRGELDHAIPELRAAVLHAAELLPIEPENMQWREYAFDADFDLARYLLTSGSRDEAASRIRNGCRLVTGLLQRDSSMAQWRRGMFNCLILEARLGASSGASDKALAAARRALAIAQSLAIGGSAMDRINLAHAYRAVADLEASTDKARARAYWANGYAALPQQPSSDPSEIGERVLLLQRLGRSAEASGFAQRLAAIGYRNPVYLNALRGGVS